MGGNVAANIATLAPDVEITTLFPEIPCVKTRYVDRKTNHTFLRVDQDAVATPVDTVRVAELLASNPPDIAVLSDYGKGHLNTDNVRVITLACEEKGIPTYVDTKSLLGHWSRAISVVKINDVELAAHLAAGIKPWEHCKSLIVTKGANGIDLYHRSGNIAHHSPAVPANVVDAAGCGDVILAALVVGYLEGKYLDGAIDFANQVGAVAVSKRGVVAVKREEVG
jgi:bifunctional ADP-heptose synthase (sugar kinase/adenylyltransferase)